jgi:predicted nucleotidyltransferase
MNKLITNKLKEIKALCKLHKVKSLYLFGSANTKKFNLDSDLDFLISFESTVSITEYTDSYFELHYKLRSLFNREIDLVTENSLSNPYFIQEIEQNKQLIYAA